MLSRNHNLNIKLKKQNFKKRKLIYIETLIETLITYLIVHKIYVKIK